MANIDQALNARQARRIASNDRYLSRLEKREARARMMIGELCRNGRTVHYTFTGAYREGNESDLIAYLLRNNYA